MALGVCAAVLLTAGMAWLAELAPLERRAAALAIAMPVTGLGSFAGPTFAGFIGEAVGPRLPFALGAAVAAVPAAALVLGRSTRPEPPGSLVRRTVKLGPLRSQPLLLGAVAVVVIAATAESTVNLLAPLQLDDNGVSAGRVGLILSGAAALFIVTGIVAARLSAYVVRLRVAAIGVFALAAALVPLAASESTGAIVCGVVLRMAVLGLLWTIAFPLAALAADRSGAGRGSVNGLLLLALGAGNTIGPLVGGTLAESAGHRAAYGSLLGIAGMTGAFLLAASARQHREQLDALRPDVGVISGDG
jgi:DHA1 family inner membrane transport protein